jgi:hypothetical protein
MSYGQINDLRSFDPPGPVKVYKNLEDLKSGKILRIESPAPAPISSRDLHYQSIRKKRMGGKRHVTDRI